LSLRIAHLSDTHFGCENAAAAEGAVEAVWRFRPSLVVVTGDITLDGRRREFAAARDWLARLPQPLLATPGNHDTPTWNLGLRAAAPFWRFRRYIGPAEPPCVRIPGLVACALNTARGAQARLDWSLGAADPAAAARVVAVMAEAGDLLKVVACHHPLVEVEGAKVASGVRGGVAVARKLAEAGVDLILSGHLHTPFARAFGAEGASAHLCGAGTLSRRTRGAPAGYSAIEADGRQISVTALGWTGSRFEPFRTWIFDRGALTRAAAPTA